MRRVLAGRGILVTGGNSGIGKAIAGACVTAGADVAICGRSESSLAAAEAELRAGATGEQRVAAIAADVSDPKRSRNLSRMSYHKFRIFPGW